MKLSRTIIAFCGACAVAAGSLTPRAHAAPMPCDLAPRVIALDEVKSANSPHDYLEGVRKELSARKELLAGILSCATQEATALEESLRALPPQDAAMEDMKQKLLGKLDEVLQFYEHQNADIVHLGISGTQEVARNLKTWRASNVDPIAEGAAGVALWIKQQTLLQATAHRLAQIETTVQRLKLNEHEDIAAALASARVHLKSAEEANRAAKDVLVEGVAFDRALTLLKNALDNLAATYQNFFEVSEFVKKILPH